MQIVIRQECGLGNQLFQYATGRYLATKYKAALRIAVDLPKRRLSHGHPRPFLLPKFAISASHAQISITDRLLMSRSSTLQIVTAPLRKALRVQVITDPHPQTYTFQRDLQIEIKTRLAYLVGIWQCYPPAEMVEEDLRKELVLRKQPQGRNSELAGIIRSTPNAVSLHIRRGDYSVQFPDLMLSTEYYSRTMRQMQDRLGNPTFFVFSDDAAFAHQFAAQNQSCIVVDHNDAESAEEDLRLMSLCRHHIIANSTFSWWGAWLNPRKDKTVIAPRKWLQFETSKVEIALPEWHLV